MPSFPSMRRNGRASNPGALDSAVPDPDLPPPPPYKPVDISTGPAAQQRASMQAQQSEQQQQYAPPPGPPPGHQPVGSPRPITESPRSSWASPDLGGGPHQRNQYASPNAGGGASVGSNNPFADSASTNLQSSYPAMQPTSATPGSWAQMPQPPSMPQGPVHAGGAPPQPQRQNSVAAHARQMSSDLAGLSLGGPSGPSTTGASTRRAASIREDPLDFLKTFDTIFVVDDSASMNVNELPGGEIGKSRWEEARDALAGVVELASHYDEDGVDIHFLNEERSLENCRDPSAVYRLFDSIEPNGTTPLGTRLEMLLLQYMDDIENWKEANSKGQARGPEPKKRNIIVITDGAATDDPESVIVAIARRLDAQHFPLAQIGIQFIQVGDDAEATEALQELDDALSKEYQIRDMVDTTTYNGMVLDSNLITKALLGGVNRRLDRKKERRA